MMSQRTLSRLVQVLLGLYLIVGVAWFVVNLGDIPRYADTRDYLHLASTLKVDAFRGFLYPAILAGVDRILGEPSILLVPPGWDPEGLAILGRLSILQILQACVSLLSAAYFLWTSPASSTIHPRIHLTPGSIGNADCVDLLRENACVMTSQGID